MKRVIIFDVMGVIFTVGDDTNELLVPFVKKMNNNIPEGEILNHYLSASLGEINAREFWLKVGCDKGDIDNIQKMYLDNYFTLDTEFLDCLNTLKKNYSIALLSNDVAEWSTYLRNK